MSGDGNRGRKEAEAVSEISDKIYLLRTQARLTQADFAERMEVSRQTVSKWELGAAMPELDKLVAISELFHVSTDYLLKSRKPLEPEAGLDRLVLRFLSCARDIDTISSDLIAIMRDGVIDEWETARLPEIIEQLDGVEKMIEELRRCLIERQR